MDKKKSGNILLYWVPALLLLLPAVYVIVLLEATIDNESQAVRNKIRDTYRSSLFDGSSILSDYWEQLEQQKSLNSKDPIDIQTSTGADSMIIYDEYGKMTFPLINDQPPLKASEKLSKVQEKVEARDYINAVNEYLFIADNTEDVKEEAIALYEAAALLKKIGKPSESLDKCNRLVFQDRFRKCENLNGNLIYIDAMLLLIELEPQDDEKENHNLDKLVSLLNDYTVSKLNTSQRYTARLKLNEIKPDLYFPLQESEGIALEFLKKTKNPDRRNILQKTLIKDTWQYTVNGRTVLLFSTDNVENKMLSQLQFVEKIPQKTMMRLYSPSTGTEDSIVSIDAANRMPGWKIALIFDDPQYMASLIEQRTKVFRTTSILVASFSIVLGFLFLRDMRRKLQLADLKNDLVANVTHELKTPLASSRLLLDTLINQPDLPRDKIESYLTHLSKENSRLCRLVEHFLAFSKLEKNQYQFQIKNICLDDLIDELNEAIQGRFPTQKQRISYECTEEEIYVNGDSQSLVTVIVNLLENALKFSEFTQKVELKIVPVDKELVFSVRDKGIGISHREQKKVFEQYYQADNRLSRKYEGSGLGLNIVKTVLKAHKSDIKIESTPGEGSCFSFGLTIEKEVENEAFDTHS